VLLALWFHDAIYDPGPATTRRRARWARDVVVARASPLRRAGSRLIIATKHDSDSIRGRRPCRRHRPHHPRLLPDRFQIYDRQIRQEYAWVPEPDFGSPTADPRRVPRSADDLPDWPFPAEIRSSGPGEPGDSRSRASRKSSLSPPHAAFPDSSAGDRPLLG
jgi:hypothetical protein